MTVAESTETYCSRDILAMMGPHNDFSADEAYWFTEGDCWLLALHLAQRLNKKVAMIASLTPEWSGEIQHVDWFHVVVDIGNDTGEPLYADISGVHTKSELTRVWARTYNIFEDDGAPAGIVTANVSDFLKHGMSESYRSISEAMEAGEVVFDDTYDIADITSRMELLVAKELHDLTNP